MHIRVNSILWVYCNICKHELYLLAEQKPPGCKSSPLSHTQAVLPSLVVILALSGQRQV